MNTKLRLCVGGLLAFFASTLLAADRTYQNAGGDLASTDSADWGGTSPGSTTPLSTKPERTRSQAT